jgi:hypothetical protein
VRDARRRSVGATAKLRGNGVELVREREMARRVQGALARLYALDASVDVRDFIEPAGAGERETLFLRECGDGVEVSLRLAPLASESSVDLDGVCQLIEGVSHFVYIAERAKAGRPATQLELEIQAEVDKYVVLAAALDRLDVRSSERLRDRLYDRVSYVHDEGSEFGDRYRMANAVAKRFTRRLECDYLARRRIVEMREALRVFFRMGQQDKLRG